MTRRFLFAMVWLGVAWGASSPADAQVTEQRLVNSAKEPQNWLNYSGGYFSQRHSTLNQITPANVKNLELKWIHQTRLTGTWQATPLVVDGVMYITGWNEIFALDATTGRQLWTYSEPHTEGLLGDAGSGSNRGAALAGDRVFMVTDHAHVLAFNRFTGEKVWDVEMANYKDGYSATVPALVVGDLLIQGMSGGDEGVRGFLDAYKISTGERVWRFWTIPKRGEPGSETWKGQAIDHGCGATWQTGAYDATLDLVYWPTGNPCPDHAGEERIGDNLYTSSVVALNAKTGQLKWYYQFTPHDTNDWDATQPVILIDEPWQGRPRKLLIQGNRNGMFYVLDRTTGEFLLGSNLSTKITWMKGFTKEGRPIINPEAVATKEGIALCPGPNGGANWPEASYSPMTKLFYTRVADSCGISTASDDPLTNNRWFGEIKPDPPAAQEKLAALMDGTRAATSCARWIRSRARRCGTSRSAADARARSRRVAVSCSSARATAWWRSTRKPGSPCGTSISVRTPYRRRSHTWSAASSTSRCRARVRSLGTPCGRAQPRRVQKITWQDKSIAADRCKFGGAE